MQRQQLTKIQDRVLNFVCDEIRSTGRSPSIREIQAEFGYASPHTAQFHVNNLVDAGVLRRGAGHRGLQLAEPVQSVEGLRLAGTVAAGFPIEAIEQQDEHINLGAFASDSHIALLVRGKSMIEECIADGDHVIVRKQTTCADGDLVVARIGDEATLKRFHREPKKRRIRLQPANSAMKPIFCRPEDLTIEGVVVGVVRLMGAGRSG